LRQTEIQETIAIDDGGSLKREVYHYCTKRGKLWCRVTIGLHIDAISLAWELQHGSTTCTNVDQPRLPLSFGLSRGILGFMIVTHPKDNSELLGRIFKKLGSGQKLKQCTKITKIGVYAYF
jgi:hypothetical protein